MKRSIAIVSILLLTFGTTAAFARTSAGPTRAGHSSFDRMIQYSVAIFAAALGNPVPLAVVTTDDVEENDGPNNNDGIKEQDGQNGQNGPNVNEGNDKNNQSGDDGQHGGGN
jgi:hypothetical protein